MFQTALLFVAFFVVNVLLHNFIYVINLIIRILQQQKRGNLNIKLVIKTLCKVEFLWISLLVLDFLTFYIFDSLDY